jgi:hypothetical protein
VSGDGCEPAPDFCCGLGALFPNNRRASAAAEGQNGGPVQPLGTEPPAATVAGDAFEPQPEPQPHASP